MQKCKMILVFIVFIFVRLIEASPITATEKKPEEPAPVSEGSTKQVPVVVFKTEHHKTQNETNLKGDDDKNGYLEKKGGNDEVVYVTKFHRAGKGGYDHYEAFHTKDNSSYARAKLNLMKKNDDREREVKSEKAKHYSAADYTGDDVDESTEDEDDSIKEEHSDEGNSKRKEHSPDIQENAAATETITPPKWTNSNTRKLILPIVNVKALHAEHDKSGLSAPKEQKETIKSLEKDVEENKDHQQHSKNLGENVRDSKQVRPLSSQLEKSIGKLLKGGKLSKKLIPENVSEEPSENEIIVKFQNDEKESDETSDSLEIPEGYIEETPQVEQGDKIKQIAEALIREPPEVVIDAENANSEDTGSEEEPALNLKVGNKQKIETQIEPRRLSSDYEDNLSDEETQKTNQDHNDSGELDSEVEDPENADEKPKQRKKKKLANYEVTEEPDEGDNPHEKPAPSKPAKVEDQKRYRPSFSYSSDEDDSPERFENAYTHKHSSEEEPVPEKFYTHSSFRENKPGSSRLGQRPGYETYILHGTGPQKSYNRYQGTNEKRKHEHIISQEDPASRYLYPNLGISFKGKQELNEYYKKYHDGEKDSQDSSSGSVEETEGSEEQKANKKQGQVESLAKILISSRSKTRPQSEEVRKELLKCRTSNETVSSEEHASGEEVSTENRTSIQDHNPNHAEEKATLEDAEVESYNSTNISTDEPDTSGSTLVTNISYEVS